MLEILIWVSIFGAVVLLSYSLFPFVLERFGRIQAKKAVRTAKRLDEMFIMVSKEKLIFFYTLTPFLLAVGGFLLLNSMLGVIMGLFLGLVLPTLFIKNMELQRKRRFQGQLVDALMVLSSSLKGGLSLMQAIEALVEEMPAPISQEFGLILRENKMGITFDESLMRLYERMKSEEMELVINSMLVARETGGDLTRVFSRLSTSIRDNLKLKDSVKTLTMQGRLQGIIMSILPVVFTVMITSLNPRHFDIMFQNETGRMLLLLAGVLLIIGWVLMWVFSRVKV